MTPPNIYEKRIQVSDKDSDVGFAHNPVWLVETAPVPPHDLSVTTDA